jgi:hypothetical protein
MRRHGLFAAAPRSFIRSLRPATARLAVGVVAISLCLGALRDASAAEISYPTTIHTRYEAVDPKVGGNFIIWLEREKVWHGLDARLYPPVKYVDVTHLTASPGSTPITVIEVMAINSNVPEFYHLAGIVRFKVTGMTVKSSTVPH